MIHEAGRAGYTVYVIALSRGMYPMISSQVEAARVANAQDAADDISRALYDIHQGVHRARRSRKVRLILLGYEELVARPVEVTQWLAEQLGLDWPGADAFGFIADLSDKHWDPTP